MTRSPRTRARRTAFVFAAICTTALVGVVGCSSEAPVSESQESPTTEDVSSPVPTESTKESEPFTAASQCNDIKETPRAEQVNVVEDALGEAGEGTDGIDLDDFVTNYCAWTSVDLVTAFAEYRGSLPEHLAFDFESTAGYTYTMDVTVASELSVTREVESQKPGEVALTVSYPLNATVTNTTAERATGYYAWALIPVWPGSSELCNQPDGLVSPIVRVNQMDTMRYSGESTGDCWLDAAVLGLADRGFGFNGNIVGADLSPDEVSNLIVVEGKTESTYGTATIVVPEALEAQFTTELRHPSYWALSAHLADPQTAQPLTGCRAENGGTSRSSFEIRVTTEAGVAACAP